MSHSTRRAIRQAIPVAVLVLGVGLARQYANGAGVFESGSGLFAKAQSVFADLRAELSPPADEGETSQEPSGITASVLESRLAEQSGPTSFQPSQFPSRHTAITHGFGNCRH
jgi:hypothetical protein